jgi:hypothetical protein
MKLDFQDNNIFEIQNFTLPGNKPGIIIHERNKPLFHL